MNNRLGPLREVRDDAKIKTKLVFSKKQNK